MSVSIFAEVVSMLIAVEEKEDEAVEAQKEKAKEQIDVHYCLRHETLRRTLAVSLFTSE